MIRLIQATLNKYKSFQQANTTNIEQNITVLVGMNEAGKTVFLEALGKMNYFDNKDKKFKFDITQDFPRKELVKFQKEDNDIEVVSLRYKISDELFLAIEHAIGKGVLNVKEFERSYKYKTKMFYISGIATDGKTYLNYLCAKHKVSSENAALILNTNVFENILNLSIEGDAFSQLKEELSAVIKSSTWSDKLSGYVWVKWLYPNLPKFWYYDDYYQLDGRININDLKDGRYSDEKTQTANALLDIAGIKIDELLEAEDFEYFTSQLEAASNEISDQIFKYWSGNKNLDIEFKIDKITKEVNREVTLKNPNYPYNGEHKENVKDVVSETVIDIRIRSQQHKISLPLDRRSKGFNWFFSFVVWFSKIKSDKSSNYILLFDEPGLNLHALAQADLLKFFEDLSNKYQIIYSTHSPFMIESDRLDRVRTVVEKQEGSLISDSLQEKDPNTLFPLQAALGYDIAQNLFITKNNLLVEGPADLIYLTVMSNVLDTLKRTSLNPSITIMPVGGLDKVSTFISLLRGQKLNVACLLDSFTDQKGKQKVVDLTYHKIIKEKNIRFFDEFANTNQSEADIEDMFELEDYLKIYNVAYDRESNPIIVGNLDSKLPTIVKKINKLLGGNKFNHYKPANKLNQLGVNATFFSPKTLDNFEGVFKEINKLY